LTGLFSLLQPKSAELGYTVVRNDTLIQSEPTSGTSNYDYVRGQESEQQNMELRKKIQNHEQVIESKD